MIAGDLSRLLAALPMAVSAAYLTPGASVPAPDSHKVLIVGQGSVGGVRLFESQAKVVGILAGQLGSTKIEPAAICAGKVPIALARWGALSLIFVNSRLVDFIYNYGGWSASRFDSDGTPAPLPKGAALWPSVDTTGGATVGDTVAQIERKDPAARIPAAGTSGTPAYLIDGNILFLLPSKTGLVSSIRSGDRVSGIEEEGGNC
jgi:hypothetical protein